MDFKLDPPVHENTPLFSAWVARQFELVQKGMLNLQDERKGVTAITGNGSIPTGLVKVQFCTACFFGDPSTACMALACRPDATAGSVLVRVFTSTGALSTTAINVAWTAYGF